MAFQNAEMTKVERLLVLFRPERYSYLAICLLSCITIIGLALYLATEKKADIQFIIGMFGSSGVIAVSMGRMMKMWNDVLKVLFNEELDENGKDGSE